MFPFRYLLAGATFSLALFAPLAHAVEDCELNGASVNPANGYTTAGKSGLMRCKDRDSGVVTREQELRNGKFMGVRRNYRNGKMVLEVNVNDKGNRDGRVREFSETGQVLRDETFSNGRTTGVGVSYYANGQIKRATSFNDQGREQAYAEYSEQGKLHNLRCTEQPVMGKLVDDRNLCGHAGKASVVDMYTYKGALSGRATYLAGIRTVFDSFWPDGTLAAHEELSSAGRLERGFTRTGVLYREETWEMMGKYFVKQREQKFDEKSGTLIRDQQWSQNVPVSDVAYYLNGKQRRVVTYQHEGTFTRIVAKDFYDDGKLGADGTFMSPDGRSDEIPVGVHKRYDEQGRLRGQSEFTDAGQVKRLKTWDESGSVTRDDEVYEDGSRKSLR
jgi:antitoxin component YwqK of YwqJK toxin-antitoxin module